MANTTIQLKKSSTPSAQPADLANGEIAINYADGKLFYKDSTGIIQQISGGGNNFSTINAAGTLIIADVSGDILTIDSGQNIEILSSPLLDSLTISANLTSANNWANTKLSNGTVTLAGALTTTGQIFANNQLTIYPLGGLEGGQIDILGSESYPDWSIDSYGNALRFFTLNSGIQQITFFNADAGSVRMGVGTGNPQYAVDVNGDVNVTGKFRINGTELAIGTTDLSPANNYAGAMANSVNSYTSATYSTLTQFGSVFGVSNGAFDKANAANVLAYNTGIGANGYTDSATVSANNYAGAMANSANAYAASLTPDLSPAFNKANDAYTVANASFDKANAANVLAYDTGIGANNYAGAMANSANAWANNIVGTSANNWANTKLSNTSGVVFDGTLNIKTDLSIGNNITNVSSIIFNTSTNRTPATPGELTWSQDDSTLRFDMDSPSNVIGHIGQDSFYFVKNQTGSTINKGTVVRFAGTLGSSGRLLIAPAIANNSYPSKYIIGVAAATINNGDDGFVLAQGKLRGINTSMFSEGDILYVSPSTAGGFSNTLPTAPNNKVTIAAVVKSDNNQGTIEVRVTLGSKLNEDELVELDSLSSGDVLQYVSANGRFENKNTLVSAFDKANAANVLAYDTGIGANAYSVSVGAAGNAYVNLSTGAANAYSIVVGAASNDYTNTVGTSANNYAGVMANSANGIADATYIKKTATTQIITGDLQITGNLVLSGNATQISANNLSIQDPLIFLATNNISDIVDIGFIGHYNNGSANVHTGVYRDHASKEYFIFNGLSGEPELVNDIVPYANNMVNAVLNADLRTSNLNLGGANAIVWIKSAFDTVNAAYTSSNADYTLTNAAFDVANAAYGNANTVATSANNYAGAMANSTNAYASATYATQTTVATNATSANNYAGVMANSVNSYTSATYSTLTQFGSVFGVANAGFDKANSANVLAKAAYDFANTLGGGGATVSATAPVSPSEGDLWWNTTYGRLLVYYNDGNTSQWVDATPIATDAKVSTINTTPSGPVDGQLWWNSEYGRLFVYYNDGDTSQWVDTNPATDIGNITDITNAAFDKANTGATFAYVNTSTGAANAYANVVGAASNTFTGLVYTVANAAYTTANGGYTVANAAYTAANIAATTGKAIAMAIVFGG